MDLISVIIPVYNIEKYLGRCLESVVNQTYRDLEILLIEDGSTDGTLDICKSYAARDSRVRIIDNPGKSVGSARNLGVQASQGTYILMVDSDDYIRQDMIEVLYNGLVDTAADMAVGDFIRGTEMQYTFPSGVQKTEVITPGEALHRIYENDHNKLRYVVPWIKLYKKKLFEQVSYPDDKIFEDIYATHHLYDQCHSIVVIDAVMAYYFQRPDSIMNHTFHLKKLDYLGAMEDRIAFFQEKKMEDLAQVAYDELLDSLVWEYSRVRDLLHDTQAQKGILELFRTYYRQGLYSQKGTHSKGFMRMFALNPELIMLYWRISGKIKQIVGQK